MTDITDDMTEKAARALAVTPWDIAPDDLKRVVRQQAERVLTAALAGRVVLDLPEPDADGSYEGDPKWTNRNGDYVFAYHDASVGPVVDLCSGERISPEAAEEDAAILLAAARAARSRSAGVSGGVGGDTRTSSDEDNYWAPEPIKNQAVAEWFEQQRGMSS